MSAPLLARRPAPDKCSLPPGAICVQALDASAAEDAVGGKARNLARLLALGLPVPPAVVLTGAALDRVLDGGELRTRIEALCSVPAATEEAGSLATSLASQSAAVRDLLMQAEMPAEILRSVDEVVRTMLPGVVAVRSSAIGEDGRDASFAGQFDSVLGIDSPSALMDAVRRCWASHWSTRALFYRHSRRLDALGMAIVVQEQVDASVAGVLFTVDPGGGAAGADTANMVIEACTGLADRLVSGSVEPDRLVVSRTDGSVVSTAAAEGDPHRDARAVLLDRLPELIQHAVSIEEGFGSPQDVEWAIDREGRVWIVQARPITTLARHPPPRTAAVAWSNANVNENFPEPISPFLYSFAALGYYHYFRNLGLAFGVSRERLAAMDQPLRAIIGVHGARMYYNLSSIHAVLRMAPFGDALADAFNRFVGTDGSAPPPRGAVAWTSRRGRLSQALEVGRILACTAWQYLFLGRRIESFERTADEFATCTSPEALLGLSLPELGDNLQAFLTIRFHRWKDASLSDAASMVCYALLERSLHGLGEGTSLHNRLLRALPGVPSSQPPVRLWALSRLIRADDDLRSLFARTSAAAILGEIRGNPRFRGFVVEFDRFLEEWGFRSSEELMLTVPSLQERPEPAIDLLRQYASCDGEPPQEAIARQAAARRSDTARVLKTLRFRSPLRALWIRLALRATQRAVCFRERARLKQALLYTRCRRIALAIGDRLVGSGMLASRDDVFMLTCGEVEELVGGRAMFPYSVRRLVEMRRREHERLAAMRPPDAFRLGEDEYLPAGMSSRPAPAPSPAPDHDGCMRGTSACGGQTTARAAVLGDVSESHLLTRGDVLVTRQTDPGWGPVFCLISGLVIERGGMLSHGAILAREFGLPCVVGVRNATRLIPHGAIVTVDGDHGTCTVAGTEAVRDRLPEAGAA